MAYKRTPRPVSEMVEESTESYSYQTPQPAKKSGVAALIIAVLVVIIVLGGAWFALLKFNILPGSTKGATIVKSTDWTAVFLTNGQVYFGKVSDSDSNKISLNDIYYLQVVNKPLQTTQVGGNNASSTQQELTLIKLGNELHGPTDAMTINMAQVLLTEKLRSDSKVVQAINEYKKQAAAPAAQAQQQTQNPQ